MNKSIKIYKKNELENTCGCYLTEQDNNNIDIVDNNNREREVVSDEDKYLILKPITRRRLKD